MVVTKASFPLLAQSALAPDRAAVLASTDPPRRGGALVTMLYVSGPSCETSLDEVPHAEM